MRASDHDQNRHTPFDRRDAEIERLRRECDELRARERRARAEAEEAKGRFERLASSSRAFATSIRGRTDERKRAGRRLTTQYAVGRVLAEAADLDDAMPKILKILGEGLRWPLGAFWAVDAGVLRCDAFWYSSNILPPGRFEAACRRSSLPYSVELPGRVWAEKASVWVEDVLAEDGFLRKEAAARESLRGALAFPVQDGEGIIGVVELFCREVSPLDEDMLRTAALIGDQIGQFVERRRAERERERLHAEVASERARFEAVLQQMPAGVFIAEPDGKFVLNNDEAERIYGRVVGSIEECNRYTSSYPDGEEISPESSTIARSLMRGEVVSDEEFYVHRSDGTRVVVSANCAPVRDEEGRIVAAAKVFEDVTWRKEAEAALEESEERLRTIVEGAPVILFALDREGVITTSVGRGLETLGLKPGELVGTSVFDFLSENPEALECVRRAFSGEAFTANVRVDEVVFETGFSPMRDAEGEMAGVIGVAYNVTERQKAQEEHEHYLVRERASRAQAEERRRISRDLHDRVAHTIGVVHQSLELHEALKEQNPEAARDKMELARRMAREALDSTRNLSVELRRPEVRRSLEAALADLLRDVVPQEVRSSLSVEGDEDAIPSDTRDQLFLILREAVRNAVKHSGCNRLAVELVVTPERAVGCVEDDGRGFDPEEASARSHNGLRSMEERASLVGGSLSVVSAPGEGTKIKVSMSLKEEA